MYLSSNWKLIGQFDIYRLNGMEWNGMELWFCQFTSLKKAKANRNTWSTEKKRAKMDSPLVNTYSFGLHNNMPTDCGIQVVM
jgi:hypothetical protein